MRKVVGAESKARKEKTVSFLEGREMEMKTVMFFALNPHKGVCNLHKLPIYYSQWIHLLTVRNPWLWDRLGCVQDARQNREIPALFIALLPQASIRTTVWARQFFSLVLSLSLLNSSQNIYLLTLLYSQIYILERSWKSPMSKAEHFFPQVNPILTAAVSEMF